MFTTVSRTGSDSQRGQIRDERVSPENPFAPAVTNTQSLETNQMITRVNNITHQIGLGGVFHGGVAIDGVEWSFGYCDAGTGVYSCKPTKVSSICTVHQCAMHQCVNTPCIKTPCRGRIPTVSLPCTL